QLGQGIENEQKLAPLDEVHVAPRLGAGFEAVPKQAGGFVWGRGHCKGGRPARAGPSPRLKSSLCASCSFPGRAPAPAIRGNRKEGLETTLRVRIRKGTQA